MSEQLNTQSDQSFQEMLDESLVSLHNGDTVKGTVLTVTNSEITVNLGYKSDGIIVRSEYTDDPHVELPSLVAPGDVFDVFVLRVNDGDGNVQVSKKRLDSQVGLKAIEEAYTEKTPITARVVDVIKGGLIATVQGARLFVPSSQISNRFVEDLTQFKGQELNFNIIEFDRQKRKFVAGRRELAAQEARQKRDEMFATLEVGQQLKGTVSRLVDFGAFIDLGGVDGLVHVSEVSWKRVRKVSDVLAMGDQVVVTVLAIDSEKSKISLTLKDINNDPWNNIEERYPVDSIVTGTVARLAAFGAFVTLEDGVDGLVHISQISNRRIARPEDVLTVGETIDVKVTAIDIENHKISLSKREADYDLGFYDGEYDEDVAEEVSNEIASEIADEISNEMAGETAE